MRRVEKSGLVVSEKRVSEEKETSALGFGERESPNLIRGERG